VPQATRHREDELAADKDFERAASVSRESRPARTGVTNSLQFPIVTLAPTRATVEQVRGIAIDQGSLVELAAVLLQPGYRIVTNDGDAGPITASDDTDRNLAQTAASLSMAILESAGRCARAPASFRRTPRRKYCGAASPRLSAARMALAAGETSGSSRQIRRWRIRAARSSSFVSIRAEGRPDIFRAWLSSRWWRRPLGCSDSVKTSRSASTT